MLTPHPQISHYHGGHRRILKLHAPVCFLGAQSSLSPEAWGGDNTSRPAMIWEQNTGLRAPCAPPTILPSLLILDSLLPHRSSAEQLASTHIGHREWRAHGELPAPQGGQLRRNWAEPLEGKCFPRCNSLRVAPGWVTSLQWRDRPELKQEIKTSGEVLIKPSLTQITRARLACRQ